MAGAGMLSNIARRLEGKVALITGGAGGIGEATARLFANHGARVVIADVADDRGQALCRDIDPSTVSYVHCDMTNETDVRSAVDAAVARHGKLDVMFNNAGVLGNMTLKLLESEKADFERVVMTNLLGSFLGTKHAARVMVPARSGSIVMTASVASVTASLAPAAYTSSKHGMLGLMRNAALELGQYGVRVNCVSPHAVPTPMTMAAFGVGKEEEFEAFMGESAVLKAPILKAEDVANAVMFLAGDESRYVSGHNLLVDGAYTSHGYFKFEGYGAGPFDDKKNEN